MKEETEVFVLSILAGVAISTRDGYIAAMERGDIECANEVRFLGLKTIRAMEDIRPGCLQTGDANVGLDTQTSASQVH